MSFPPDDHRPDLRLHDAAPAGPSPLDGLARLLLGSARRRQQAQANEPAAEDQAGTEDGQPAA